jgi:hypothetical protein
MRALNNPAWWNAFQPQTAAVYAHLFVFFVLFVVSLSVSPKISDFHFGEFSHFGRHAHIALPHVAPEYKAEADEFVFS